MFGTIYRTVHVFSDFAFTKKELLNAFNLLQKLK